ncbi:MAG: hypothetical protein RLY31_2300 [Bacteroidota bacterium]|jgi:hypothetical protein
MRRVAAEAVTECRIRCQRSFCSPLREDAGTRIFSIRLITGIFFFCNFLIGRILGSAALFYYVDLAPRFAERGMRRWAGGDIPSPLVFFHRKNHMRRFGGTCRRIPAWLGKSCSWEHAVGAYGPDERRHTTDRNRHPARVAGHSRSIRRRIFPTFVFGSSERNSTDRGTL